jgi:hypothetical protein
MLKAIPKSDISIRPFKAYKEWDKDTSEASLLEAVSGDYTSVDVSTPTFGYLNGISYNKHSLYGQLRAQFYNGHEDNPFLRFGNKSTLYNIDSITSERFLDGSAKVISIPQSHIGLGIKKKSITITDGSDSYTDDGNGNLFASSDRVTILAIDFQLETISFSDNLGNVYNATLNSFNLETGILSLNYNSNTYSIQVIEIDFENEFMRTYGISFLPSGATGVKIGNAFYTQGLLVMTRDVSDKLLGDWELSYKSTETIYENEYLLIVNPDEFNVSTNPSSVVSVGIEYTSSIDTSGKIRQVTTNPGVRYIRKKSVLETGEILDYRYGSSVNTAVSGGFEHWEMSGSVDTTGSFLTPFITTIGLYDDNCNLVAVAKLPQPIKSEPDIPVNFIVRFDT